MCKSSTDDPAQDPAQCPFGRETLPNGVLEVCPGNNAQHPAQDATKDPTQDPFARERLPNELRRSARGVPHRIPHRTPHRTHLVEKRYQMKFLR